MQPLGTNDIVSELSYAYLHAVVSRASMSCRITNRLEDNNGIDAQITAWGPFEGGGYLEEIDFKIQLKATTQEPVEDGDHYSYFLRGIAQYNDLRKQTLHVHRFLVLFFLPGDASQWLSHHPEALTLRRCAFWASLRGAPASTNESGQTIRIPKNQVFSPDQLSQLASRLSRNDIPTYSQT